MAQNKPQPDKRADKAKPDFASPPAGTGGHSDFDSNVSLAAGNPDARGPRPDTGPLRRSGRQEHGGGTGASVAQGDSGEQTGKGK